MKLNKEQKDIIKHIQSNEITDIYSFVKHYGHGSDVGHDKSAIENFFNEQYCNNKYKCKKDNLGDDKCVIAEIDEHYVWAKPTLDYIGAEGQVIEYKDIKHGFSLFEPTYICENVNVIISFIALWQYLKSEGLIIELPKSCLERDMGLFLRKVPLENCNRDFFSNENLRISDMSINITYFLDWKYELDEEAFEICLPYLNMKIYPTPNLSTYILKKHNTLEDIRDRRNMKIAFASVIIALITSIASIIISMQDKGYYNELNEINNSLQEIHTDIFNNTDHDSVEETTISSSSNIIK